MILEIIDKAIAHCKACRPNESGHGVTLSFLNGIREKAESKEYELIKAKVEIDSLKELFNNLTVLKIELNEKLASQKEEIERLKKEMIEEVEKAVDFYEVSALKMPKWTERELYIKKLKEKYGIV